MRTEILRVNLETPEPDLIAQAAAILRAGGLVAFPTETVYGLGANALDSDAVAGIFAAKGRPSNNPLIVHVADTNAAQALALTWPETAARLAERFWPGPLTLILPRCDVVPDAVTAGGATVALRVPAHPVALALLRQTGFPLAAPSANRSLAVSPTQAAHVALGLDGRIALILDAGPTSGGLESTVLDLSGETPCLLRPGLIAPHEIEAVLGPIARVRPSDFANLADPANASAQNTPLPAPGMMARHYAPRALLELADAEDAGRSRVQALLTQGQTVGWIIRESDDRSNPQASENSQNDSKAPPRLTRVVLPADPPGYAARLYATLHALDAQNVTRIVVALPPANDAWLAVRDRLQRAASPEGTPEKIKE